MCILPLLTSRRVSQETEPGFRPDWSQIHRGGNSYRQNLINACNRFLEQGAPRWSSGRAAFLRIVREWWINGGLSLTSARDPRPQVLTT
jgi:hypothetical protein